MPSAANGEKGKPVLTSQCEYLAILYSCTCTCTHLHVHIVGRSMYGHYICTIYVMYSQPGLFRAILLLNVGLNVHIGTCITLIGHSLQILKKKNVPTNSTSSAE